MPASLISLVALSPYYAIAEANEVSSFYSIPRGALCFGWEELSQMAYDRENYYSGIFNSVPHLIYLGFRCSRMFSLEFRFDGNQPSQIRVSSVINDDAVPGCAIKLS